MLIFYFNLDTKKTQLHGCGPGVLCILFLQLANWWLSSENKYIRRIAVIVHLDFLHWLFTSSIYMVFF